MFALDFPTSLLVYAILFVTFLTSLLVVLSPRHPESNGKPASKFKSYPFLGHSPSLFANRGRLIEWTSDIARSSPTLTGFLRRPFGLTRVITANPAVVEHILKTNFPNYQKGDAFRNTLSDLLGGGIFVADGDTWKFQRQVASHEFNTKSLRHFIEHVVDTELDERLIPILASAAANDAVLDLQDVLQRFAFDNVCRVAFGYDPVYLTPSMPQAKFAVAFDDAVRISSQRFRMLMPLFWKMKRFLNIGSEKRLKEAVAEIRQFALEIINGKKTQKSSLDSPDLLSRFLSSGHSDEEFVTDIVVSFILAGRDTTSAALTWFFWLLHKNPRVEAEILKEITHQSETPVYNEVKEMVYTHASLCESMRLYPPVPVDTKTAAADDVLPDGTLVKKGMMVSYHPYAMGRVEKLWGEDCLEFRPERWLEKEKDQDKDKLKFVQRDSYTFPVFQAGPRICLGKEMAFMQMKTVVAGVLRRFEIVPVDPNGKDPVFIAALTSKMQGGFPVRIKERK